MRITMIFAAVVAACFAAAVCAAAAPYGSKVVKESAMMARGRAAEWVRADRADPDQKMVAHVFVKQSNLAALEETLYAVSDPASPRYGQHLSREQVDRLVAPHPESIRAVTAWLEHHGVTDVEPNGSGDTIRFHTDVRTLEAMLGARYYTFKHRTGRTATRADGQYSLPTEVHSHVDFVGPTIRFPNVPRPRPARAHRKTNASAPLDTQPSMLRDLYKVGSTKGGKSSKTVQGVASFLGQFMAQDDLQQFFGSYNPGTKGNKPVIVGPNDETQPGTEASLDIQYIMSLGQDISTQFWSTPGEQPGSPGNEPFEAWLYDVGNATNAPVVFSVSYGDDENSVVPAYAVRVNAEFQKAGARGITLLFSSGDGGVSGGQSSFCSVFVPTFPAASPYVTAVGGTTQTGPEVAASFSSGGFSNYWPRPSYQDAAVTNYFQVAQNLPSTSLFNTTGAGFPDISAQATDFVIVQGGGAQDVDGTSCSAPTVGGIIALLVDARLAAGKGPLGWLNPLIYSHSSVFTDVTSGNNPGCFTNGFQASPSWDPVTGFGTPNFQALLKLVMSLP